MTFPAGIRAHAALRAVEDGTSTSHACRVPSRVPSAFARQPRNHDVILAIVAERPSRYRCTDQTAFGDLARVRASHFPASLNADS
jgi:hypothetical protein